VDSNIYIIDNTIWEQLTNMFKNHEEVKIIFDYIYDVSIKFNIDKRNMIKNYLNYIIRYNSEMISEKFLHFVENIMHVEEYNNKIYVNHSVNKLSSFF
jgi:hypothetical protein